MTTSTGSAFVDALRRSWAELSSGRVLPRAPGRRWLWGGLVASSVSLAHAVEAGTDEPGLSELNCVVMPSAVIDVSSGMSGRIETIDVERGDRVQAGQIVAELESGVEKANLVLARARAGLETEIHLHRDRLAFEERKRGRTERLHTGQAVSAHERDEAETDAKLAGWHLRRAFDEKYLAGLEVVRAAEVLRRRSVQSPIDGVVVERFKWPGEYVEEEPIVRVARLDPLWVEVIVPVAQHGQIRKNMLAEVMAETEEGNGREAKVIVMDPMGDAASGTFRVRLELPNPDRAFLGGVKCKARFPKPARYAPEPRDDTVPDQEPGVTQPDSVPEPLSPRQAASPAATPESTPQLTPEQNDAGEDTNGYIVLTPSPDSGAARRELTAALREAGVSDFLFLGGGPYAGHISLGVYDARRMAERRSSRLSALGFETIVFPRSSVAAPAATDATSPVERAGGAGDARQRRETASIQKGEAEHDGHG